MTTSDETILGQAEISSMDALAYLWFTFARRAWLLVPGGLGIAGVIFWRQIQPIWNLYQRGRLNTFAAFGSLAIGLAILVALMTLGAIASQIVVVRRMGLALRRLSYEIDEAGIVARDALGALLSLPWSNMTRVRFTKRLMLIAIKPRVWRYMPLRAFSAEDVARLKALAGRMVA